MATVANAGIPGSPVDLRLSPKYSGNAFQPNGVPALQMVSGAASTNALLPRRAAGGDDCVRMYNSGSAAVRVKFGVDNTVVALPTDKAIAPGATEVFSFGANATWVAVYSAAAGSIEFNCGGGI